MWLSHGGPTNRTLNSDEKKLPRYSGGLNTPVLCSSLPNLVLACTGTRAVYAATGTVFPWAGTGPDAVGLRQVPGKSHLDSVLNPWA